MAYGGWSCAVTEMSDRLIPADAGVPTLSSHGRIDTAPSLAKSMDAPSQRDDAGCRAG
jgi:hypothetical protein